MKHLSNIKIPSDIKKLSVDELPELAEELRQEIVSKVSKTGGHLASSLGAIELTVAMHYVFDPPADKFIWDVSHQTYGHKILTGRGDQIHTLRQYKGLARVCQAERVRVRSVWSGARLDFDFYGVGFCCRPR